jgi:hypothetical protein
VSSLVIEGVFERFPRLKVVMIEGGFGWLPALTWRLDKVFERMRDEVPHLKKRPSEYIRQHIWVTTQPMEEPDDATICLRSSSGSTGLAAVCAAAPGRHWDGGDPFRAFLPASSPRARAVLAGNAGRCPAGSRMSSRALCWIDRAAHSHLVDITDAGTKPRHDECRATSSPRPLRSAGVAQVRRHRRALDRHPQRLAANPVALRPARLSTGAGFPARAS